MPSESKAQQIATSIAEHEPSKLYARNRGLAKMSHSQLHDFASTMRRGLPEHARRARRAANESRAVEGSFSVPLDGRRRRLGYNEMQERGQAELDAINESRYLVTAKKDGKTERHLPVHDAEHMGYAHAALFSPGGFRGQRYEGPDKEEAKRKLLALYKRKGIKPPEA